jgi:hypothetical protein
MRMEKPPLRQEENSVAIRDREVDVQTSRIFTGLLANVS